MLNSSNVNITTLIAIKNIIYIYLKHDNIQMFSLKQWAKKILSGYTQNIQANPTEQDDTESYANNLGLNMETNCFQPN